MALESYGSFEELKSRLDEIVEAVNDKDLPLDQALSLYEEAVGLGLRASDLLEPVSYTHLGGRMKIEHDTVQVISGVRFGRTIGLSLIHISRQS